MKINNLAVWGDSILKGVVFDTINKKYKICIDNAANIFSNLSNINIINNSKFGCTAIKACKQLTSKIKKGNYKPDVALIEFGGNDCDFNWREISKNPDKEYSPNTPLDSFCATIKEMIDILIKNSIKPILMNLPPIDHERYFDWVTKDEEVNKGSILRWLNQDKSVIYRHQELYSNAIEEIARSCNVRLIRIRDKFLSLRNFRDYMCIDGIHLNERGQKLMGEVFYRYLINEV